MARDSDTGDERAQDDGTQEAEASGVDALIEKLRREGVESGRSEAQRLIDEAEAEKRRILDEAEREAQRRRDQADQEIKSMRKAAHDSLHQAARDTVLALRQQMHERFATDVRRLISEEMREQEVLKQLILSVAGRTGVAVEETEAKEIEIELPRSAPGLDELRQDPDALRQDALMRLVLAITGDRLREGLHLRIAEDGREGLKVVARGEEIEFDLTEEAMAKLILQHLQPRFRALLDGLVA